MRGVCIARLGVKTSSLSSAPPSILSLLTLTKTKERVTIRQKKNENTNKAERGKESTCKPAPNTVSTLASFFAR